MMLVMVAMIGNDSAIDSSYIKYRGAQCIVHPVSTGPKHPRIHLLRNLLS